MQLSVSCSSHKNCSLINTADALYHILIYLILTPNLISLSMTICAIYSVETQHDRHHRFIEDPETD